MRRWLSVVLLATLSFGGCKRRSSVRIAIMTTADLQSYIIPHNAVIDGETLKVGGLERIASAAEQVREEVDGALLLSSGDDLLGPLFSLFHGEPEMRGMTLAGYDIVTPGNHEFDNGVEVYKTSLGFAGFDVVSANLIIDDKELADRIRPYVIKEVAGVRIGIFGMMTPELLRISNPSGGGVDVNQDIVSVAKSIVDELKDRGCDIIIGLTHIGAKLDRKLAQEVKGIDIIVGGHDHKYVYDKVGNTIIVQDGAKGEYLGVLRFIFQNSEIVNPEWQRVLLDSTVGYDPEIQRLMGDYMKKYNDRLGEVIGESEVDLDARKDIVRSRESNIGNLIADSWLDWFKDAEIALVNGGSIRGDRIYPAGPITYLTVNEILPFRNEVVEVKVNGSDLKQVLEVSASALRIGNDGCPDSCRAPTGGFLQIGGLKITIDTTQPPFCAVYSGKEIKEIINPGSRIVDVKVYKDGIWTPLDSSTIYTIVINGWLAEGGDGHYIFSDDNIEKEFTTVITTDILVNYIQQNTPISPRAEGRINFNPYPEK